MKKIFDITETIGEFSEIPEVLEDVFTREAQHALPHRSRQPSRSVELNLVLYNGIAGQPETQVIRQLRTQLWQEHLGLDTLPEDIQNVPEDPANMEWVKDWNKRAKENLEAIKKNQDIPADHAPKILEWVPETSAEDYLAALKIPTKGLRDKAYTYDFEKCKYTLKKKLLPWPII